MSHVSYSVHLHHKCSLGPFISSGIVNSAKMSRSWMILRSKRRNSRKHKSAAARKPKAKGLFDKLPSKLTLNSGTLQWIVMNVGLHSGLVAECSCLIDDCMQAGG